MNTKKNKNNQLHQKDFEAFTKNVYEKLLAFAKKELGDDDARDAVQDALADAFKNRHSFSGNSAFESWVFAILKHKIIDIIRQHKKTATYEQSESNDQTLLDAIFDHTGHWQKTVPLMDLTILDPAEQSNNEAFWHILKQCMDNLPPQQAKVFLMKECMDLSTNEICQTLSISPDNFYAIMYRARLRLQVCLSKNWFYDEKY